MDNRKKARLALQYAIDLAGGKRQVAAALKITEQAINGWVSGGLCPLRRTKQLATLVDNRVTVADLRPDIADLLK